jgi:penicillin-binding protein 1A
MSRRDRFRRRRHNGGDPARMLFLSLGVAAAALVIGVVATIGWVVNVATTGPSLSDLTPRSQGEPTVVYASDGTTRLGFIGSNVLRTPISSEDIPQTMRDATVAVEDKRFYEHKGVDFEGVVRAAIKNITSGKTVQGGSTLTMQLIRNLYVEDSSKTFKRKIREAKLAEDLEDQHPGPEGKRWILDQYLNNVPYGTVGGQTLIGVQAAARVFFGKRAQDLNLREAALLAGLPQAPSQYNPVLDRDAALARRNEVLRRMADQHYIGQDTASREMSAPLDVKPSRYYFARREGYFFDYVKQLLADKYKPEEVARGGFKVYTTINLKLQKHARKVIASRLPYPEDPSAALVSIDPKTGYIKAMASSSNYGDSEFNLAAQGKRQPGSTFKIMVLMTALRRGVSPTGTYWASKRLGPFIDLKTGSKIDVQTDDHVYRGPTNLFDGLVRSDNTVYQQADLDMGPEAVQKTAYDMGITSHVDPYPAAGLGGLTHGVSPLELTRAYVTINTGGWRIRPIAITKVVKPDGTVDNSLGKLHRTKVFSDGETSEAIKAMQANMQRGTGTGAQIGCPAAGKTGTTEKFVDAWFAGFTPALNTTVWVGYPKANVSMTNVPGWGEMFGGKAPASIWHDFMATATAGKCAPFPTPTEPFIAQPFKGRYTVAPVPFAPPKPQDDKKKDKKKDGNEFKPGDSGGQLAPPPGPPAQPNPDGTYPPDLYQSPPQGETPPPVPPPGNEQAGGTPAPQ